MRFGKRRVRFSYSGQPKTCRKCGAEDHIVRDCTNTVCYNCDKTGHVSQDCEEAMRCCICKSEHHMAVDCPHSWYKRPRLLDTTEYPDLTESAAHATPGPESATSDDNAEFVPRATAPAHGILSDSSSEEGDLAETTEAVPALNSQGLLVPKETCSKQPTEPSSKEPIELSAAEASGEESQDDDSEGDGDDEEMGDSYPVPESLAMANALKEKERKKKRNR